MRVALPAFVPTPEVNFLQKSKQKKNAILF
jgi:hypothetical protein